MGEIVATKILDEKSVVVEVLLDYEEALALKGHMKNVHVFSEEVSSATSQIATRGAKDATRYFLIPRELREELDTKSSVKCHRIDTPTKSLFVYSVDKITL